MDGIFCCEKCVLTTKGPGAIEIGDPKRNENFNVNRQRLKLFLKFQTNDKEVAMVLREPQFLECGNKLYILYSFFFLIFLKVHLLF